jgi:hypothetical protein
MSSSEYGSGAHDSDTLRRNIDQLRAEFEALVRDGGPNGGNGNDDLARLIAEVDRLRSMLAAVSRPPEPAAQPCDTTAAAPAYPPFPPFPAYPPVPPFPPYPPYPASCGCCAPSPCGCGKQQAQPVTPAPTRPDPEPPSPPQVSSSSSPAPSSSSSQRPWRPGIVLNRPSSSSSSSRFWTDVR